MADTAQQLDSQQPQEQGPGGLPPLPALGPRPKTRRQVRQLRIVAGLGGIVWLVVLLWKTGMRPDRQELPWLYAYALPGVMVAAGLGMLGLALAGGRLGVGTRPRWARLSVIVLPALFAISSLWTEIGVHSVVPSSYAAAWPAHVGCAVMTLVLGAGPFAIALMALRRAFPASFMARGALVGLCCGLAAAAAIHLHCPIAVTSHILVSHGSPLLLLTLLGAALARRIFRT